jgi:ornithine carbamoyltransferase
VEFASPDLRALLDTARRLRRAAASGRVNAPLRGKNVVLLSNGSCEATERVRVAAMRLGAQVTHLRPDESRLAESEVIHTAQMLGRLYDAIDCESMPPALVAQIDRNAGVPVFNGLGAGADVARALGDALAGDIDSPDELREWLVQAALVNALD